MYLCKNLQGEGHPNRSRLVNKWATAWCTDWSMGDSKPILLTDVWQESHHKEGRTVRGKNYSSNHTVRLEGSSEGYVVQHQFKEEPTSKWDLIFLKFSEVTHSKADFMTLLPFSFNQSKASFIKQAYMVLGSYCYLTCEVFSPAYTSVGTKSQSGSVAVWESDGKAWVKPTQCMSSSDKMQVLRQVWQWWHLDRNTGVCFGSLCDFLDLFTCIQQPLGPLIIYFL